MLRYRPIRKFPIESQDAKKPGIPGFLLTIGKDHLETSSCDHLQLLIQEKEGRAGRGDHRQHQTESRF